MMVNGLTGHAVLNSTSEAQTTAIGEALGAGITGGTCICVTGSLGSGKSVLVRGICRGLGVNESVVSPSFILCEEYSGRLPIVHSDLYRLEHERDIEDLGLFEQLDGKTVVLVEWGDRSPRLMREADVIIHVAMTGATERAIDVSYRPGDAQLVEGL